MGTSDEIPKELSHTKPIRLFKIDADAIEELCKDLKPVCNVNIQDIIRHCVHVGLPIIQERWKPLLKEKKDEQT